MIDKLIKYPFRYLDLIDFAILKICESEFKSIGDILLELKSFGIEMEREALSKRIRRLERFGFLTSKSFPKYCKLDESKAGFLNRLREQARKILNEAEE